MGRPASEMAPGSSAWIELRAVAQGGAFAVIAWSGFRYHALLRRRLRLGLADPVVANRIWLWNLAASGVAIQYLYGMAIPWLNPFFGAESAAPAVVGTLGIFIALCITYAFHPPPGYLRWVETRSRAEVG